MDLFSVGVLFILFAILTSFSGFLVYAAVRDLRTAVRSCDGQTAFWLALVALGSTVIFVFFLSATVLAIGGGR